MTEQALTKRGTQAVATDSPHIKRWTPEEIQILRDTVCKDGSPAEIKFFGMVCARTGLDPFARQIHAVKRWSPDEQRNILAFQVGIDGFRLQAERSGQFGGPSDPEWCGQDGDWTSVWLHEDPPWAARVFVKRNDFESPVQGIAYYADYVQTKKDGSPNQKWAKGAPGMLAKCAEALGIRRGFPQETSGLYIEEEVMSIGVEPGPAGAKPANPRPKPRKKAAPKPGEAISPPYGDEPKTPLSQLSDKWLDRYLKGAETSLNDPQKARFRELNQVQFEALLDERNRRTNAEAPEAPKPPADEPPHPAEQPELIPSK